MDVRAWCYALISPADALDAHEAEVWNEALEEAASLFHHMCGQEGSRMTCHTEDCPKCRILARAKVKP